MAKYVDGFVLPVSKAKLDDYRKFARRAGKVWIEHGAIDYVECVADDVPFGKRTSFPRSVERKNSETVIFAWVTYKSKAQRDKINKKVFADPRIKALETEMGFIDGERMYFGGFDVIVDL
ncbi:MAG: DUF1428 domain-containing protein [Solirubrobacterales bacterium]